MAPWRTKEGQASAKTDEMREAGKDSPFADMTRIEGMDRGDGVAWSNGDPTKAP